MLPWKIYFSMTKHAHTRVYLGFIYTCFIIFTKTLSTITNSAKKPLSNLFALLRCLTERQTVSPVQRVHTFKKLGRGVVLIFRWQRELHLNFTTICLAESWTWSQPVIFSAKLKVELRLTTNIKCKAKIFVMSWTRGQLCLGFSLLKVLTKFI